MSDTLQDIESLMRFVKGCDAQNMYATAHRVLLATRLSQSMLHKTRMLLLEIDGDPKAKISTAARLQIRGLRLQLAMEQEETETN